MWSVSERFKADIGRPHQISTSVTMTPPGGSTVTLRVAAGSVTADRSQRIRRTATLAVYGGSTLYDLLSLPGTRIAVDHGIRWSGTDLELVPMIRGELASAGLQLGDGLIQIQVADLWQGLAAADYLTPFSPATTAGRVTTAITAVNDVYPGITVRNTASDVGTVGTSQVWTSRADMITSLSNDGGFDVYFAPDGALVVKNQPQITDPPAWLIKTGTGGSLESLTRNRPLDKVYNAVILTPATADSSQAWTQVTATITDTTNPRHPSRLGRTVPYRWQSPTALTNDDAVRVAALLLAKVQGSTETLSLGAMSNPALEPGDVVRAVTPIDGGNDITQHFLDSVTVDLESGSMTCGTRAAQETL